MNHRYRIFFRRTVAFWLMFFMVFTSVSFDGISVEAANKITINVNTKKAKKNGKVIVTVKNLPKGAKVTVVSKNGSKLSTSKTKSKTKKTYTSSMGGY